MNEYLSPEAQEALRETWPSDITHVSASSMKMLARCPEQYRQVYILGKRQRPGSAAIWGRADHGAVEWALLQKRDTGTAPSRQDVEERFLHEVGVSIEESGGMGEIRWNGVPSQDRDDILRKGSVLAGEYGATAVPLIVPSRVEESFSLDIGMPVPVVGRIDLIGSYENDQARGSFAGERIMERKTSGRTKKTPEPDWVAQARIYQMVEPLPHDWHVSLKLVTPRVDILIPGLTIPAPNGGAADQVWLRRMVALVGSLFNTYGPGDPWPGFGTTHPWACGYCGFRPVCTFQSNHDYIPDSPGEEE